MSADSPGNRGPLDSILARNAAELTALHKAIHASVGKRYTSPENEKIWKDACAKFHLHYDELAFPGGYERALNLLKAGDLAGANFESSAPIQKSGPN